MSHSLTRRSAPRGLAVLALLLAGLVATPAQAQWSPKPYFSPNGGGQAATAELINKADTSIDIAMYSISTSGPIWNALDAAVKRGVRVRCILNKATSQNRRKATALEGIGVHVFKVSRTMHEKFALFDAGKWWRRKLVNGSANWSSSAETRYSENTVVYGRHYHLFYAFQQEYNHLLSIATPVSAGADQHQAPVRLNTPSKNVRRYERAVFSSANSGGTTVIADEIIALMDRAQTSIEIDVAHFNSVQIATALINIARNKPNVRIEVMVDMGEYGDKKSRCKDLEAAGIPVRYKTYSLGFVHPRSQLQHHKTVVIDELDMITGSYNWSDTAETKNYENIIVVQGHVNRNKPLIASFVAEHDRLWGQNRATYAPFLAGVRSQPGDANYRRYIPIHFDTDYHRGPMSLTRDEIRPLRSAYWAAGLFERQPNGKRNVEFTYLDREEKDVFKGTPSGTFLPAPTGTSTGLSGSLPGQ